MVEDVNAHEVSREDFLSDNVFHYDSIHHELQLCGDHNRIEAETVGMEGLKSGGMKL